MYQYFDMNGEGEGVAETSGPSATPSATPALLLRLRLTALQVEHILTLISQIFGLDIALVCLCAHERVYIRNARGFSAGNFPFRWGFCGKEGKSKKGRKGRCKAVTA